MTETATRRRLGARELLDSTLDAGSFVPWDRPVRGVAGLVTTVDATRVYSTNSGAWATWPCAFACASSAWTSARVLVETKLVNSSNSELPCAKVEPAAANRATAARIVLVFIFILQKSMLVKCGLGGKRDKVCPSGPASVSRTRFVVCSSMKHSL